MSAESSFANTPVNNGIHIDPLSGAVTAVKKCAPGVAYGALYLGRLTVGSGKKLSKTELLVAWGVRTSVLLFTVIGAFGFFPEEVGALE